MPPRKVDERKTRKALRKLRRAVDAAEGGEGAKLSDWEQEFAKSVETRLETYGSAFRDPSKGALEEPLSARQAAKLSEIGRKARGAGGGLKRSELKRAGPIKPKKKLVRKTAPKRPPSRRDVAAEDAPEADAPPAAPPALRVIKGGRGD